MRDEGRSFGTLGVLLVPVLVVAGCAGVSPSASGPASTPAATASASATSSQEGTLTRSSGASVDYSCSGTGAPAILLEAGTDTGGSDFRSKFIAPSRLGIASAPTTA